MRFGAPGVRGYNRFVVSVVVGLVFSLLLGQQPESKGSGTITINGVTTPLTHAIKTTRKNLFNDFFSDTLVVLSNQPVTQKEADDDAALFARAQKGELITVIVRFDGRPKRGQLFNVALNHQGLQETALLPDVWFKYTFKGGAGTLKLDSHEFAGRTYATEAQFAVPMPVETVEETKTASTQGLPPASTTDRDRQIASQLLIGALQEGDEARALAIVALGIDANARDPKMNIAVINWAVLMCQPQVVAALVDLKADLSHERLPGMTLLSEARAACPEAVGFLKAGGAK
jgi:hypothetical protein